ncbi:MAG: SDR family NAD(P)-dependent oxidoreductase [Dokdonella sp.]
MTRPELFDLSGRTALITGGSRGLGLQIAHALGSYGARLLISARKADELQAAKLQLETAGIHAD